MKIIKQTDTFLKWLKKLKDVQGKVSILRRIERIKRDNFGDYKSISADLWELRVTTGPGYRVYYTRKGDKIIILLVGGDKSSQGDDIKKAKKLLEEIDYE
ncbi:MAG TPA: hypothetical protein CFH82_03465 [Sulfurospirillum sp. UBA12182]|jgi:putative addiction module killer protein|nr:MAG TPA: hypothetical protein CFH82_03465 [Sulfurospirillum sp. UBA12182]